MLLLLDQISATYSAQTVEELIDQFQDIISAYGFEAFTFADITKYDVGSFAVHTDRSGWIDFYKENNFALIDPSIDMLRKTNLTFTWSEAEANIVRKKPEDFIIKNAAYDFGLHEGIVVPIHYVDSSARMRSAVCALFWHGDLAAFTALMRERRAEVEIITSYWARRIIDKITEQRTDLIKEMHASEKSDTRNLLTPREVDVLIWASRGKTSAETATILGISTETVNHHLKYAISKLKVSNKVQAVAHAIYNNLIHL